MFTTNLLMKLFFLHPLRLVNKWDISVFQTIKYTRNGMISVLENSFLSMFLIGQLHWVTLLVYGHKMVFNHPSFRS